MIKRVMRHALVIGCALITSCYAISDEARLKGFVDIHDIDPTIRISVRYASADNFVGKPLDGYHQPVIIMTKQTAEALKKVQQDLVRDGYSLVIYDAYRPQKTVDQFIRWAADVPDQVKKDEYYPRVEKSEVFNLGYVARRSGHSRGSTVDLTIIKTDCALHPIEASKRVLSDGFFITFLDDGTVDMGSSFDLFDVASHYENNLIDESFKPMRAYLKQAMERHGFKNYSCEWWHFTLIDEPYRASDASSYFNFDVE